MIKLKRIKKLEYPWIFKGSFCVRAYTLEHNDGNTYCVFAHDFNDMNFFLTRFWKNGGVKTRVREIHGETDFEERYCTGYIPDKNGNPMKRPFWYRGRVYKVR